MKKIITILLVSLMVLTLTGCNSKKEEETVKNEEPVVQEVVKQEEPKKEETVTPTPEVKEEATVVEEVTKEEKVDVTTLSYWVNFLNYDGTVISRKAYKYGSTPVAPVNPTYEDGVIYYNFLEWDKKVSPVYGTQTYKALYEKTGYVHKDEPSAPVHTLWDGVVPHTTLNQVALEKSLKFNLSVYPSLTATTTLGSLLSGGTVKVSEDILNLSIEGFGSYNCYITYDGNQCILFISNEEQGIMAGSPVAFIFDGDVLDLNNGQFPTNNTPLSNLYFCVLAAV